MKKYIYLLALCAILPLAVSCKSAPKAQEADITSPEEQAPAETAAEQAPEPDTAASEIPADTDAAIIDDASAVTAPQNPPEMEASAALIEPDPALTEAETPPPAEVTAVSLPEPAPPPSQPENIPSQTAQTPPAETAPAQPPAAPDIVAQTHPPAAAPESVTQTPPPAQESPAEESPAQEETAAEPPRQIPALPETAPSPVPLTNAIDEQIVLSRIVRVTVGQLLEIPFRGTGWVYLGETSSLRGIAYNSRRIDPEGQSFVFRVEAPGTYTLKFFKQDFVRDFALNDYVQVIAGEAPEAAGSGWFSPPAGRGRVTAVPRWPDSLEEAAIAKQGGRTPSREIPPAAPAETPATSAEPETAAPPAAANQNAQTPPQVSATPAEQPPEEPEISPAEPAQTEERTAEVIPAPATDTSPETLLQNAKNEFEAGRASSAIALLDQYKELYPAGSDEAYWLYGQAYEANTPDRNILTALDYYRRIVQEYPQSARHNDARKRIAYLERFYINIQ